MDLNLLAKAQLYFFVLANGIFWKIEHRLGCFYFVKILIGCVLSLEICIASKKERNNSDKNIFYTSNLSKKIHKRKAFPCVNDSFSFDSKKYFTNCRNVFNKKFIIVKKCYIKELMFLRIWAPPIIGSRKFILPKSISLISINPTRHREWYSCVQWISNIERFLISLI